jgi:hypothetical protein
MTVGSIILKINPAYPHTKFPTTYNSAQQNQPGHCLVKNQDWLISANRIVPAAYRRKRPSTVPSQYRRELYDWILLKILHFHFSLPKNSMIFEKIQGKKRLILNKIQA